MKLKLLQVLKKFTTRSYAFDAVFIALAIFALAIFYFTFKRQVVFITVRAKMIENDSFAVGYGIGDKERDALGRTVSEIVNVYTYKTGLNETSVFLDIKLKATYDPKTKVYTTKGRDILFGESLTIAFTKARFKGFIVDLPGLSESLRIHEKKVIITAQNRDDSRQFSDTYGVPSYLATALRPGDAMTDAQGNVIAKILDVSVVPAKRVVISENGLSTIINDLDLKDVFYTIELSTKEVNGKLFMHDYAPLFIGTILPFNARNVAIWPTVTEIKLQ